LIKTYGINFLSYNIILGNNMSNPAEALIDDAGKELAALNIQACKFLTPGVCRIYGELLLGSTQKRRKDVDGNITESDWTVNDIIDAIRKGHEEDERSTRSAILRDYNFLGESLGDAAGLSEPTQQLLCDERDFLWTLLLETYSAPNVTFANPYPNYGETEPYRAMAVLEAARRNFLPGSTYLLYDGVADCGLEDCVPGFNDEEWWKKQTATLELLDLDNQPGDHYEIQQRYARESLNRMTPEEWTMAAEQVQGFIIDYLAGRARRTFYGSQEYEELVERLFSLGFTDDAKAVHDTIEQRVSESSNGFGQTNSLGQLKTNLLQQNLTWADLLSKLSIA
jgi:hypothetical protein